MVAGEQLKKLFHAFNDQNEAAFYQAAEAIIAEELAANHHSLAKELKKALVRRENPKNGSLNNRLTILPKDRRNGEELVVLQTSSVDQTKIVLCPETKAKIDRILDEHRKRTQLAKYGYAPKTKLLFWGPPGCGKTFAAHFLAYELGLPIGVLRLNATISSFLGETAFHLQRIFNLANVQPMVLLLDEVDAIGKNRDDRNEVGELKRVVNSLLQAMDTFHSTQSLVIAASNHQYLLDPALWRRFDDLIHFPFPDEQERERYLRILANGVHFEGSPANLANAMNSLSFADIERVTVEAIKTMILEGRNQLRSEDISLHLKAYRTALTSAQSKIEGTSNE